MEPYHLVNSPDFRVLLPETAVPTAIASAGELEDVVVAADPGLREGFVSRLGQPPPGGWSLRDLASGRVVINPVLDQGWAAYPWGTGHASPA
ncbi:UNVERIFIED_CONTAM: hypothetical protein RKD50_009272 [Streptomyces canus]